MNSMIGILSQGWFNAFIQQDFCRPFRCMSRYTWAFIIMPSSFFKSFKFLGIPQIVGLPKYFFLDIITDDTTIFINEFFSNYP